MSLRFQDVLYAVEMTGCFKCRWDVRMFYMSLGCQDVLYVIEISGCWICR